MWPKGLEALSSPVSVKERVEVWLLLGSVGTQGLSLGGLGAFGVPEMRRFRTWASAGPWRPRRTSMERGGCGPCWCGKGFGGQQLRGGPEPLGGGRPPLECGSKEHLLSTVGRPVLQPDTTEVPEL